MIPKEKIDELFDYVTLATIGACFTAAVIFIAEATLDSLNGWNPVTDHLYSAGICLAFGIIVSLFLFYIKSWGQK